MTDYPDPHILASLEANAEALRERYRTSIQVAGLAWGDEAQETYVQPLSAETHGQHANAQQATG